MDKVCFKFIQHGEWATDYKMCGKPANSYLIIDYQPPTMAGNREIVIYDNITFLCDDHMAGYNLRSISDDEIVCAAVMCT